MGQWMFGNFLQHTLGTVTVNMARGDVYLLTNTNRCMCASACMSAACSSGCQPTQAEHKRYVYLCVHWNGCGYLHKLTTRGVCTCITERPYCPGCLLHNVLGILFNWNRQKALSSTPTHTHTCLRAHTHTHTHTHTYTHTHTHTHTLPVHLRAQPDFVV